MRHSCARPVASRFCQSSIAFGTRKTLQAEQGNKDLQAKVGDRLDSPGATSGPKLAPRAQIAELQARKQQLHAQHVEHQNKYDALERRSQEKRSAMERKFAEEKEFVKTQVRPLPVVCAVACR